MDQVAVIQQLSSYLKTMDVPSFRKSLDKNNLLWLSRNLGQRNSDHPDYTNAIELVRIALKEKFYKH